MNRRDPYLDDFPSTTKEVLHEALSKTALANFNQLNDKAIPIPWPITQATLNCIHRVYSPIRFRFAEEEDFTKENPHFKTGTPCTINNVNNVVAHPIAKTSELIIKLIHNNLPDAAEIGTNLQGPLPHEHFCTLMDSRDSSRLHSKLALTQDDTVNNLLKNIGSNTCATDAKLCQTRSNLLFMSHVYSISTSNFARIMRNKGSSAAKVCMFLPQTLMLGYDHDIADTDIRLTYHTEPKYLGLSSKRKVLMHFKDSENLAYSEDYDVWMSWLDTPVVNVFG
jgi:hypothetical protein